MGTPSEPWDVARALHTYNIARWGNAYFGVNDAGNMTVRPVQDQGPALDLMAVIGALATVFTVAGTTIAAIMLPWYTALACGVGGLLVGFLAYAGAVQAARPYAQLVRSGFERWRRSRLRA